MTEALNITAAPDSINKNDLELYFSFLAPENEIFTAWYMNHSGERKDGGKGDRPVEGLSCVFGKADKLIEIAEEVYRREKGTLHVLLNRTNDKGRRKENVTRPRVLCVDLDNFVTIENIKEFKNKYQSDLIVESSPGKYHLYWKIDIGWSLEIWSIFQSAVAYGLGGDGNLSGISHSIRCPGVPRVTKEGEWFTPRIVWFNPDYKELSQKEAKKVFSDWQEWADKYHAKKKDLRKLTKKLIGGKKLSEADKHQLGESRNRVLYDTVLSEVVRRGKNGESVEIDELLEYGTEIVETFPVNGKPPLEEYEILKTCRSALETGLGIIESEREKTEKVKEDYEEKVGECEFDYDYSDEELKRNRFTDLAVLVRISQRFKDKILRDDSAGTVYAYHEDAHTWVRNPLKGPPGSVIYSYVDKAYGDVLKDPDFLKEFGTNKDGEIDIKLIKKAEERFRGANKRDSIARAVLSYSGLKTVNFGDFDSNLEEILVANGVLNLRTGELREPEASDMLLFRTPIVWDENSKCPEFEQFIAQVFEHNEEPQAMVDYILEIFGYSLSGRIDAKKIYCHYGDGSNGKSKLLDVLSKLMGDYGMVLPSDDLVSKKNAFTKDQERIGTKIEGKRCALIDDISTNAVWNEERVKAFSTKELPARRLFTETVKFKNRCKCHVGLNKPPTPESANFGIFRRMAIIPYCRTFDENMKESERIDQMIEREISGILKLCVKSYQKLCERGSFLEPQEVKNACQEYQEQNSTSETILQDMYRLPEEGEEGEFISNIQILKEFNDALVSYNYPKIDALELGRTIKKVFKVAPVICKDKERKSYRAYNFIRLQSKLSFRDIL